MSGEFWAILVTGALTIVGSIAAQLFAAGKMRGEIGVRLDGHDEDLRDLKADKDKQWEVIGKHGERLARVENGR